MIRREEARVGRRYVFMGDEGRRLRPGEGCILRMISDSSSHQYADSFIYLVQSIEFQDSFAWTSREDLILVPTGKLLPDDISGLVCMLGDFSEEHGWPDGGQVGMDLAAEVERLEGEHRDMIAMLTYFAERYELEDGSRGCEACDFEARYGHRDDCPLGKLLARLATPPMSPPEGDGPA